MDIHIGNVIAGKMKEMHISNAELASRIKMGRMNVHSIVRRKTVQTDLLETISRAMNYDFFQHYNGNQNKQAELTARAAALEKKLQAAEAEILTLNRVIEAMRGKVSG